MLHVTLAVQESGRAFIGHFLKLLGAAGASGCCPTWDLVGSWTPTRLSLEASCPRKFLLHTSSLIELGASTRC